MSESSGLPPADKPAPAPAPATPNGVAATASTTAAEAAKKVPEQNPALKAMGLPRLRLPSRNWMIFWSILGGFTGAVMYDKWQTKRMREKWCHMVSHLADEPLGTKHMPRRLTIYLAAPPGDGLRNAREHFHNYVKPVLVAAAMDWDVVEGRKEGDVRHKTAEKIRKRRKRAGEGEPLSEEEAAKEAASPTQIRQNAGVTDYPGVAGDIVIGRHTWIEYLRGIHEGYLGPVDPPKNAEEVQSPEVEPSAKHVPGVSLTNTVVGAATKVVPTESGSGVSSLDALVEEAASEGATGTESQEQSGGEKEEAKVEKKEPEEEKPQRRFPVSYILPEDYAQAPLAPHTPEIIGPSIGVRFPHLLGIRNTPFRLYRFLTRRRLADDVGRQVASAILASHRPYTTTIAEEEDSSDNSASSQTASGAREIPEQTTVLAHEQRDWWKTVRRAREEHEESVWIEPIVVDERILSRMRKFELTAEDEQRATRISREGIPKDERKSDDA